MSRVCLTVTDAAEVSLSPDRGTVRLVELNDDDWAREEVHMPVSVAFRIADAMLREFPECFPGRG